jgi:PadR family transcriptional regulator AphA
MTSMSLRSAILGFLQLEPSTGYLLLQRFQGSVGSFWTATQSQIYRELHNLEQAGKLRVEVVPQAGKPARKVYTITPSGRADLQAWLREPIAPAQLRDPLLLKLVFAADLEHAVLADTLTGYAQSLQQTRSEYQARLASQAIFSLARSERERVLWELSIENGLAWCEAQIAWTERALKRLARVKDVGSGTRPPGSGRALRPGQVQRKRGRS